MIPPFDKSLLEVDRDREFQTLPPAVQRAYKRLWALAAPYDGRVSEPTLLRLLRASVGAPHVPLAIEALLGAGLLMEPGVEPGVYELLTPAQREGARVFAEASESSELDAMLGPGAA